MTTTVMIVLALYVLLYLYVLSQINFWLKKITGSVFLRILVDLLFILPGLMPLGGAFLKQNSIQLTMETNGNIWMGFLAYLAGGLFIFNIIRFFVWLFTHRGRDTKERQKNKHKRSPWLGIFVLGFCILLSLTLNIWGNVNAHRVNVQKYNIALDKKTTTSGTLKVALIADLHLGANTHTNQIRAMVRKLNDSKPDVVLIAGDIFTSSYHSLRNPDEIAKILRRIRSKQGVYAVYGNHDVEERLFSGFAISPASQAIRSPEMTQFMQDAGFQVLEDQTVYVNGVQIVGRVDGEKNGSGSDERTTVKKLTRSLDSKMPIVVLQHEPIEYAELANAGVDLTLNGHTHNGQIFPGNLIVRFFNENTYGLKRIHSLYTLVTSGVGYYGPPIRIGTQSEIALINLSY